MDSDNKDDTTPKQNQDSSDGKVTKSPMTESTKKVPPILSDKVSSTSVDASLVESKVEPELKPEPKSQKPESKAQAKEKPEEKPAARRSVAPKKEKKSGSVIGWLALLIALLALAGVAYGLWILQQDKQSKGEQQSRIDQSQLQLVDSFKSSTQALSGQVQGFISKSENQQQRLADFQAQLKATSRQIGEVTQVSRRSWMLAEAEYLLRLANQRLLMERETASAMGLLRSVDQILASVDEPGLFDIRETLARETAALRAVAHLDVEGVFVKLTALGQQVESLALLTPDTEDVADTVVDETTSDDESSSVFATVLENFNGLVTVRRRDEPLTPLLTPQQHYYVQQNLRLMLEQAQLALLQRRPGVYTHSLNKAVSWVDEYFQLNETAKALLMSLRELESINVDPELPDISKSLALLKAYLSNAGPKAQQLPAAIKPNAVGVDASADNTQPEQQDGVDSEEGVTQ